MIIRNNITQAQKDSAELQRSTAVAKANADYKNSLANGIDKNEARRVQNEALEVADRDYENTVGYAPGTPSDQEGLGTCPHCGRRHVLAHLREGVNACPDCGNDVTASTDGTLVATKNFNGTITTKAPVTDGNGVNDPPYHDGVDSLYRGQERRRNTVNTTGYHRRSTDSRN
jgi:hypothetical protein